MHLAANIIRSTKKEGMKVGTRRIKGLVGKYEKKKTQLARSRYRWNDGTEVYMTGIC